MGNVEFVVAAFDRTGWSGSSTWSFCICCHQVWIYPMEHGEHFTFQYLLSCMGISVQLSFSFTKVTLKRVVAKVLQRIALLIWLHLYCVSYYSPWLMSSRPDLLDAALLRPGRLDRLLICDFPSPRERSEILEVLARKVRFHSLIILMGTPRYSERRMKLR